MHALVLGLVLIATACAEGSQAGPTTQASPPTTWYSMAEKAELFVACMQSRGFDAELYEGIGIIFDDRDPASERAGNDCWDDIDAAYPDPPPPSDRERYDYLLWVADCLRREGIQVSDPPTFDTWADTKSWTPYTDVVTAGADFWALHRKCPQSPGIYPEGDGE